MANTLIALMIYGEPGSGRNVFTEEKYKKLAAHFVESGFDTHSVCYHDSIADTLAKDLGKYAAILVWVNPIEQQGDRTKLDSLLAKLSLQGCFVSAHPDTILKIGTKEILYKTRDEDFGTDVQLYRSYEDFLERFLQPGGGIGIRILKQYRGNGGKGVFKIDLTERNSNRITVTEATQGDRVESMGVDDFYATFRPFFVSGGMLIDQVWNPNIVNGMVRCYLSGSKVAGFGYQEVNALYPGVNSVFKKPGQRFYFTEECGLFRDLKQVIEMHWVKRLQKIAGVHDNMLPVIWDADFFINRMNAENPGEKYSLCEINVSSVSPFPESAIPYIVNEVRSRVSYNG